MNSSTVASPSPSPDRAEQSQWLQVTLSDVNKKMNAMTNLLEDGSFSDGTESFKKRRQEELLQMLEEFKGSYCSLAEKYDRLRYESDTATDSGSTLPSSFEINKKNGLVGSANIPKLKLFDSYVKAIDEGTQVGCQDADVDIADLKLLVDEQMSIVEFKTKFKTESETRKGTVDEKDPDCPNGDFNESTGHCAQALATSENLSESSYEWGNTWCDLKSEFTNLMEENMQKQAELARRNVEKTMVIDRLRLQLEQLKGENRELQSCISCLKVGEKHNEVQIPQLRRLFSGKFIRGGCS